MREIWQRRQMRGSWRSLHAFQLTDVHWPPSPLQCNFSYQPQMMLGCRSCDIASGYHEVKWAVWQIGSVSTIPERWCSRVAEVTVLMLLIKKIHRIVKMARLNASHSVSCFIPIRPHLAYVNKLKALFVSKNYQVVISTNISVNEMGGRMVWNRGWNMEREEE